MDKNKDQSRPVFLHLAYLQQVSELLSDQHGIESQAARLGHIAQQIGEKHVVHINGADPPKLNRCKACQAFTHIRPSKGKLVKRCSLCGLTKPYSIGQPK